MTLNQSVLEKHIRDSNHQKLETYLANFQGSIPEEILALAGQKFLESDNNTISNSYSIIKLLAPYADPATFDAFKSQDAFITKYSQYIEHRTNRDILKVLDDKIEKDYVYPIKYPEKTSFIRKLLRLPHKRKSVEVLEDFKKNLPNMISKLKEEIMKDEKLKDTSGNMIISPEKLNSLIYERISLKATKQLRLDRLVIDRVFEERNLEQCAILVNGMSLVGKQQIVNKDQIMSAVKKQFHELVPPHMISGLRKKLSIQSDTLDPKIQSSLNNGVKKIFQQHIQFVEQDLQNKQSKGLNREAVNILHNLHVACTKDIIDSATIGRYKNELNTAQEKFYEDLGKIALNTDSVRKKGLMEFEKEGIDLLRRSGKLNSIEKSYLTKFIEYAASNKEFNYRLDDLKKHDNILAKDTNYSNPIEDIYKYSHKTSSLSEVKEYAAKLSIIMNKYDKDPNTIFTPEEKVSLVDLGYVMKFCDGTVKDVVSLIDMSQAGQKTKALAEILSTSQPIWNKFQKTIGSEMTIKDGDIIMNVAKQYHDMHHHKKSFKSRIRDFITPYSHAAIGLENVTQNASNTPKSRPMVSHVMAGYVREKVDSKHSLFSEQFIVNPSKLMTDDIKAFLANTLGIKETEIEERLKQDFRKISQRLHSKEELKDNIDPVKDKDLKAIVNDGYRGIDAGLADIIPFGHHGKKEIKSWAKKVLEERNQGKSLHKILGEETDNKIICSEFAAKMTVLALSELDNKITTAIQEKHPDVTIPKEGVIKLPFLHNEDLSKVSPARLVKELQRAGAIEKVEKKGIVQSAIRHR